VSKDLAYGIIGSSTIIGRRTALGDRRRHRKTRE
jgi:hypothetical protein